MPQNYSIAEYLDIYEDEYKPLAPKPHLQQYDNYQIYSLVCCDYPLSVTFIDREMVARGYSGEGPNRIYSGSEQYLKTFANYSVSTINSGTRLIAYQQFSATPISVDFSSIALKANVQPLTYRRHRYEVSRRTLASYSDNLRSTDPDPIGFSEAVAGQSGLNNFDSDNYAFINSYNSTTFGTSGTGTLGQEFYYRSAELIQVIYTGADTRVSYLDMFSLITGYSDDPRTKPNNYPQIVPSTTGKLTVSYYRNNPYEPIQTISSLDWHTYQINLIEGQRIHLPIADPVFGTLIFDGEPKLIADVKSLLSVAQSGRYNWSDYFVENIDSIIDTWKTIQNSFIAPPPPPPDTNVVLLEERYYSSPIQRVIFANNNYWNNDNRSYQDINFIPNHSLFKINNIRAHEWHIYPQVDNSYGSLIMDSIRTIEIHKALDAGRYALNSLDASKPRVTNIGHLVEKVAFLLGYRPDDNGEFSKAAEKKRVRRILPANKSVDPKKVGVNNFGEEGMVLSRNINRFGKGKIVDDECVVVHDLIQLMSEFQDRHSIACGLQESSAVEINGTAGKSIYNNQLEILIDTVNLVSDSNNMIRAALVSSLVTQGQTSEIISGLGLPSVTKTLPVSIDGKSKQIPYKGIAAHRSISQEIATCAYNIGIVTGQLI